MKTGPVILGVDPGFASLGYALASLRVDGEHITDLAVIRTEKDVKKRNVMASDDNVRRARDLARALLGIVRTRGVVLIAAESMSFPRSSSVAAKMALSWGAIATVAEVAGIPIVQASPQKIKKVLCGTSKASKEEVEFALLKRYGRGIEDLFVGPDGLREHVFDALGAIVAGLDSDAARMARQMAKVPNIGRDIGRAIAREMDRT